MATKSVPTRATYSIKLHILNARYDPLFTRWVFITNWFNPTLIWAASEHLISHVIMVTFFQEWPGEAQINRTCLLFGLWGVFQPHWGYFLLLCLMGWGGQLWPNWPWSPELMVLDRSPQGRPGHRAAVSSTELQLPCLWLMPLLLLSGVASPPSIHTPPFLRLSPVSQE